MHSLAQMLRTAAAAALPGGAFLRRDRGDALFVTDAPRFGDRMDWAGLLFEAGFYCAVSGGLLRLWPAGIWLSRLEAACPEPPDDLCQSLSRFRGRDPDGESLKLFAFGMRCLDGGDGAARFDRKLRQRAGQNSTVRFHFGIHQGLNRVVFGNICCHQISQALQTWTVMVKYID